MPRALVAAWRLSRVLLHGLHGLTIIVLRFAACDAAARHARVGWWSAKLLRLLGVTLTTSGVTPRTGAKLIVANHISWLDIAAIHAVMPDARFVSKADVRHWPLVGRLVTGAGTLSFTNPKFLENIREADTPMHMTTNAGCKDLTHVGDVDSEKRGLIPQISRMSSEWPIFPTSIVSPWTRIKKMPLSYIRIRQ